MSNDVLTHYGVKGMKWGVRRTPEQLARARGKLSSLFGGLQKKKTASKSAKSSSGEGEKKKISDMSDDELRRAVNRMQLEKQYRELNAKSVSIGKKFVDKTLKTVVVPAVTTASRNALTKYIEDELNKQINKNNR